MPPQDPLPGDLKPSRDPRDASPNTQSSSAQRITAYRIVDDCVQLGAQRFFIAPGSRSTPLTMAIANHPDAQVVRHFDERGLAFACLGYGRATRKAGVFVCTSGTAVANALPAVVEASLDHVPMLLLTADRPPELRDTGANQTVNQVNIFGEHARWQFDLPCATSETLSTDVQLIDSTMRHAAQASRSGPVHLNCMFREPFDLDDCETTMLPLRHQQLPTTSTAASVEVPQGNGLVIVGKASSTATGEAVEMARRIGCPILADITAGHIPKDTPQFIARHDLVLLRGGLPAPDFVIHVGGRVVSKRWHQFLEHARPEQSILFTEHEDRFDPVQQFTNIVRGDLAELCRNACRSVDSSDVFRRAWEDASAVVETQTTNWLAAEESFSELSAVHRVTQLQPKSHAMFLGNSLSIRLADMFRDECPDHVAANRGASGIDGLIATAVGYAIGLSRPTTAIVGDLSALHDLNSLSMLAQSDSPVHLVILNNDGGGIFHLLPVAKKTPHFESMFAMPHGYSFEQAAGMFGIGYGQAKSLAELDALLQTAVESERSTVTELIVDRHVTAARLRAFADMIRAGEKQAPTGSN